MTTDIEPTVGNWYITLDNFQRFTINAINEYDKTIEIQFFDGNIEELGFAEWEELEISLSAEPESWAGAIDIVEIDDFGTEVTDTTIEDWNEA